MYIESKSYILFRMGSAQSETCRVVLKNVRQTNSQSTYEIIPL